MIIKSGLFDHRTIVDTPHLQIVFLGMAAWLVGIEFHKGGALNIRVGPFLVFTCWSRKLPPRE
jgi:hypothetical protein